MEFTGTSSYLTDPALETAVRCALVLEKPLLVRGEPGTGKTLLAEAVAEALGMELVTWNVKSTTRAQEGLYIYDTVQRLYDSRFGDHDVQDIADYIHLGPMGQAFSAEQRVVLLIDEIDKADLEFPNDLLARAGPDAVHHLRDRGDDRRRAPARGHHHQQRREGAARRLPATVRVPLHRLPGRGADGPDRGGAPPRPGRHACWPRHSRRSTQSAAWTGCARSPSTSELIDWIAMLRLAQPDAVELDESTPFLGTLLKKEQDLQAFNDQINGRMRRRF